MFYLNCVAKKAKFIEKTGIKVVEIPYTDILKLMGRSTVIKHLN